jgi:methyl-accepting chemotaxis protein-1 (serine sensor receptor)
MLINFSIKTRLIAVICLLTLELIIGAGVGLVSLSHANRNMNSLYEDRLVRLGQLDKIVRTLNLNQLALAESLTSPEAARAMLTEIERNTKVIDEKWDAYLATELTEEEARLATHFASTRDDYLTKAFNPAVAAIKASDLPRATQLVDGKMNELFKPVRQDINGLIKVQLDSAAQQNKDSRETYALVRTVCLAGMSLGLLIAAAVGTLLVRGIVTPLNDAVRLANAVAGGDLTQEVSVRSRDETGRLMQALKDMNAGLVNIIGQVRGGTDTIATAASQIAVGNLDLSSRTEQQAGALEETASSMEELTSTVKQNADNASQANTLVGSASSVASKGRAVVSQVVNTMGEINESSRKIVEIISVIDGIAFQTNLLALNAAVEAARAGEQGRGFAVVASEVRTLAQRSAAAAKEIKTLIDASVKKVEAGSRLVDQAGATMSDIVDSVTRVTDIMAEIAAAGREQTAGIEQVNEAINQMDRTTQQNAALVEEASAAAQELRDSAGLLAAAVGAFRLPAQAVSASLPPRSAARAARSTTRLRQPQLSVQIPE